MDPKQENKAQEQPEVYPGMRDLEDYLKSKLNPNSEGLPDIPYGNDLYGIMNLLLAHQRSSRETRPTDD